MNPTVTHTVHAEAILESFLEMVQIDSPSGQEEPMRLYLDERFKQLGLQTRSDGAGNLIVEIPAQHCSHSSRLILSGHMDVVPPCIGVKPVVKGEGDDRWVHSDNTTVLGADDKAALAVIVEVVEQIIKESLPCPAMRLILTTEEEVGLRGAKEVDDAALDGDFSLIFDHTGEQGVIINEAPTHACYKIEFFGKSTHAGLMPEQGVNAIVFAGRVLNRFHIGRLDADTTANVGKLSGGKATNVVPDYAVIEGEIRSHNPERVQEEMDYIRQVLESEKAAYPGADYRMSDWIEYNAYRIDPESVGVKRVIQALGETGLKPDLIRTNGGSDLSVFYQRGLTGVVMSAGYVEPHSLEERLKVKDLVLCGQFLMNAIQCFAREAF